MSYSDQDLNDAVKAGVFSEKHVDAFRQFMDSKRQGSTSAEEHFRLVTGFNDIFVSIACGLVLFSTWYLGAMVEDFLGPILTAISAWGLAEYFTRIRRMALPSILLLLSFILTIYAGVEGAVMLWSHDAAAVIAPLAGAIGASLHWFRFRVPITIAAGISAVIVLVMALMLEAGLNFDDMFFSIVVIAMGIATLCLAIYYDSRNVFRITRQADIAFWLHILSSFVIVHTLFSNILLGSDYSDGMNIFIVLATYSILTVTSIILDRRALMVSALGYAVYAAGNLLTIGNNESISYALACLVIGGGLLMLSALWAQVRRPFMMILPDAMTDRLPPA